MSYQFHVPSRKLDPGKNKDKDLSVCHVADLNVRLAKARIKKFPSTRYYGSKKRLLPWIYDCLKDIPFKSVLDGFGGTSSVSLLFKAMGKEVTFNDALLYNGISAKALLADSPPFSDPEEVRAIFSSIRPMDGFISKTFKGKFYTDQENAWLDGAVYTINSFSEEKRNALYYSLFQACLQKRPFNLFHRANLSLRLNGNGKQSFGNQTTWETPFPVLAYRAYRELAACVWPSGRKSTVLPPSNVSEIDGEFDLVYLDPPYISLSNSGDDYLRRYHFLEGLCRYHDWPQLIDNSYKNLQFKKLSHISDWQKRATFKEYLFSLIYKHRHSFVVLSYVDGAFPRREEIDGFFHTTFKEVKCFEEKLSHALSNGKKRELLFIGVPK